MGESEVFAVVELAQPPGIRATRTGGEWKHVRGPAPQSVNYWMVEFEAFLRTCPPVDQFLVKDELAALLQRARDGRCTFGRGAGFDVDHMKCAPLILELKFMTQPRHGGRQKVHLRLYFSEPDHTPGEMYIAKLAWKVDGKWGLRDQDAHAREAQQRVIHHFA